jgi:hypothetical protein
MSAPSYPRPAELARTAVLLAETACRPLAGRRADVTATHQTGSPTLSVTECTGRFIMEPNTSGTAWYNGTWLHTPPLVTAAPAGTKAANPQAAAAVSRLAKRLRSGLALMRRTRPDN